MKSGSDLVAHLEQKRNVTLVKSNKIIRPLNKASFKSVSGEKAIHHIYLKESLSQSTILKMSLYVKYIRRTIWGSEDLLDLTMKRTDDLYQFQHFHLCYISVLKELFRGFG